MDENLYWKLELKDGSSLMVPPSGVAIVKRKMLAKEPIPTRSRIIPFSEIKDFQRTSQQQTQQKLLEDASRAFNEPVITENGVKSRWVKKDVTSGEYERYYGKSSMYHYLASNDGLVTIAFVLPVHQIDFNRLSYCTPDEEKKLEKR